MVRIRFVKGHGLGNSFLVIESDALSASITPAIAQRLCSAAQYGVDGILVVGGGAPPYMHIFNSDGSTPEMCGNGVRVVAQYLVNHKAAPDGFIIDTPAGKKTVTVRCDSAETAWVSVDMGLAEFIDPHESSPHRLKVASSAQQWEVSGYRVSMGNPHFIVLPVDDEPVVDRVLRLGPLLEVHADFPDRTNVECIRLNSDGSVEVAVWERGCGFTQACGTGACAAIAVASRLGWTPFDQPVIARLPGGDLEIEVRQSNFGLRMTGPSVEVEQGWLELEI